jgi:CubicO group peptidase (beta-lactamase class C family)
VGERYAPGFTAGTPLPGWSMTKAVIGALVGVLVKEGKLSLSDKKLLPEWEKDARSEITLEDLLRMRSGLRFNEDYANPLSDVNQMLWTEPDCGRYAASRPLAHAPGTHWQYSSGTTNILCRILRRAVGEAAYPEFPRRALFGPLGMRTALIEPDAAGAFVGSSFMFASARDWARFGLLYMNDGIWEGKRILPEGWAKFSASPTPQSEGQYGAHWWLKLQKELGGETEDAKRIPPDAFYALGHEDQSVTVIPSRKLVAVRLGLSIYIDAWNHAEFVAGLLDALDG